MVDDRRLPLLTLQWPVDRWLQQVDPSATKLAQVLLQLSVRLHDFSIQNKVTLSGRISDPRNRIILTVDGRPLKRATFENMGRVVRCFCFFEIE